MSARVVITGILIHQFLHIKVFRHTEQYILRHAQRTLCFRTSAARRLALHNDAIQVDVHMVEG